MTRKWITAAALLSVLAACSEASDISGDEAPVEQGGEAAGDVEGGSISDAMIPLEQLRSQSPPIRRQTTTATTTTTDGDGGVATTVETTSVTSSGSANAPAPGSPAAPPPPPPPETPRG